MAGNKNVFNACAMLCSLGNIARFKFVCWKLVGFIPGEIIILVKLSKSSWLFIIIVYETHLVPRERDDGLSFVGLFTRLILNIVVFTQEKSTLLFKYNSDGLFWELDDAVYLYFEIICSANTSYSYMTCFLSKNHSRGSMTWIRLSFQRYIIYIYSRYSLSWHTIHVFVLWCKIVSIYVARDYFFSWHLPRFIFPSEFLCTTYVHAYFWKASIKKRKKARP